MPDDPAALEALRKKYAPQSAPVDKFAALKAKYAGGSTGVDGVRSAIFGDVADESKTPATPEDLVTVADRLGMRRKVAKTDFPMERYLAGGVADDEIAAKQAEFDAPVVADIERQAGPIRTKADVRRLTDAADVARAQAQYTAEHPTHPKMPDQFTDPAEARRLMVEAPDRRRERAEYEKAGVASPFLALTGARVARAASFGAIDMEKMAPPEQRRILAAQAETATPVERFGTGIAETASMMATVNPFAKGLTTALKALKVSEGTAATVGNLLAASAHGGITEGSVEGAVRTGLFMGGQTALGRVFRGAAPTAGRYAGSEFGAGATASAIAQLATEGHVDPVQTLSDAVTNTLFGLGGARAAGKARRAEADAVVEAARQRLTEEIRKGRELQDILRDADFAAMVKQAQARPGEGAEMLAEPARPVAPDLVAENEMLAGSRTPEIAPESDVYSEAAPESPAAERAVSVAPAASDANLGGADPGPAWKMHAHVLGAVDDLLSGPAILTREETAAVRQAWSILARATGEQTGSGMFEASPDWANRDVMAHSLRIIQHVHNLRVERNIPAQSESDTSLPSFSPRLPGGAPSEGPRRIIDAAPPPAPFQQDRPIRSTKASEKAIRKAGKGDSRTLDWQYEGERFAPNRDLPDATKAPKRWVDEYAPPVDPDVRPPPAPAPLVPEGMERLGAPEPTKGKAPPDWSEGFVGERPVPPDIPTEPTPRPGKAGERGAVDVSGAAATAARGVRTVLGTETQKIRDLGTPSAREFADLLEKADDVRQERSGPITPARRRVEIFASRPGNRSAAKSLTTPDVVRDTVDGEPVTYALPRGERIVNGEATARSPKESQLVDLIEAYWQERGKGFEAVGTMRTDPKTGERVPFKTPKGTWPRIPHQDGLDLMLIGERDKAWAPLVRAVAHANGIPVNAAGKILGKMRERLLGLSGVTGPETGRVSEAEVFRELKHMPSDIWVRGPVGTRRISILETDPVTVVRRATDMGTSRMGVIASFGQDLGDDPKIDALRRKFLSENAGRGFDPAVVWDKAIRMAHAIPKNDPTWTASHPMAPLARGIKSFFGLVKTGKMSNRWAPNVFEWTGAPREFVGLANQAKVQLQRFRDFVQTGEGREAVARDLERRGAIIDEGLAIPSNPSHPFSQALHITRQLMDTATLGRPMESSQEHGFARGADLRLKQMQARKGQGESHAGERDVLRLMQVGVPETQARKLAYGEGTQAEYDTALRTAMNKAIGANTSQLSRSPLENSKIGKLLWYNSWASMNLRHAGRTMLATIRGVESAFAPGLAPEARVRRLGAATRTFLSWATGRAVSNAAATAVVSLVTGGTTGLSANVAEAKDDFGKFLTKSFLYGIVGGPYAAIIRNAGDNLSKQIQGVATPVSVVSDMIDAVSGSGRYMDKSGGARVFEIVRTYIPFVKSVISATAAVTGDTVRLHNDAAEQAYFRWRKESGLYEKSKAYEKEPSEFRAAVSTITDLIEAGKMTSAREEYEKAQKIKAPKNTTLAKSIMDRRLLTIPDMKRNAEGDPNPAEALEMMKALRRHIGETAYAELENRDKRIMEFLNTIGRGR